MNQLQVFKNDLFGELPVIVVDGVEWFGATEAASALSFANPHKAIDNHVDEEDCTVHAVLTDGGTQSKKFINESGLYSLIFGAAKQGNNQVIREKAKGYKRWVTGEVLPTIRKTGGYVANDDMFIETYLPHADEGTKLMFRVTLENVRRANERIRVMQPKADYFDALVERNLLTNFRDTAKELQIGERKFIGWLLENGYLYRDAKGKLKPYARYVPGLFELKEWERNGKADNQTLVTPKGRETFRLLLTSATAV
jgi:phage antirepressor YoqD-like protein